MKLTKTLMCAAAVGAMAFASDKAQAVVIDGYLFAPLSVKLTVNVVSGGKIIQKTATTKDILNTLDYSKGTILAVGPGFIDDFDIFAVYKVGSTWEYDDLVDNDYFEVFTDELIDTSTGDFPSTKGTYSDAGVITIKFASDEDLSDLGDNSVAFNFTGTYTYNESDSAVVSGLYKEAQKFGSSNLSGEGYIETLDEFDYLPVSGTFSGSGSGSGVEY